MKKKLRDHALGISFPGATKILLKMKLTLCIILFSFLGAIASESYSQTTKLTLNLKNSSVRGVLGAIENQSEFFFLYSEKIIDVNRKVNIEERGSTIEKILDKVFAGTNVDYTVKGRQIVLTTPEANNFFGDSPTQQQKSVSGKVTDSGGSPLPGVSIVVKGTTTGTITDANGNYSISNVPENSTLQFSFVGMKGQEISIGTKTLINVSLVDESIGLDEVVAVGYGTMRKKDLTGSIGQVNSEEIRDMGVSTIDQVLVGKESGVQVKSVTGQPGSGPQIRIRGIGSISAGATPLFVVDGFPTDNIQSLNPNDIESLDILKDASATAIYGSRGANGVIIINTKRGKVGEANISFDMYYGLQQVYQIPAMMNAQELSQYALDGMRNKNTDAGKDVSGNPNSWRYPVPQPYIDVLDGRNNTDMNMVKQILQIAPQSQYQLSANGGSENIKYSVSGEYLNQEGVVINTNFKRYSLRANLDAKLSERIAVKLNVNPSLTDEDISYESNENNYGSYISSSPVDRAQLWPSVFPAVDENGDYFMFSHSDAAQEWNPYAQVKEVVNKRKRSRLLGNFNVEYSIFNGLKLNIMFGGSILNTHGIRFEPELLAFAGGGSHNRAYGRDDTSMDINWISENTLNYVKSFGKHNITGLLGFTSQKDHYESNYLASNRYPNNLIPALSAVSGIITAGSSNVSEWTLVSYLARGTYNYNSKYYLTASIRTDGSSRFGADKKYGLFPSAALAWRISEENFLKDKPVLSDLKLRLSYGITGNNDIGRYEHIATINYDRYTLGGGATEGFSPSRLSNPLLTWETQDQINTGFDLSLFDSRFTFKVDYFNSKNTNLLLNVNIPATTGFNTTLKNIGEVKNNGWEFMVSSVNTEGAFEWTTDFNISAYKNEVIKLGPTGDPIYSAAGMVSGANITMIGEPIGMFYGLKTDGIFLNQSEVDKGPIFGEGTSAESRPGDYRFVDVNGDGKITNEDQTIMGSPYPDFYYGMTNRFSYKNLSLTVSLQGTQGSDILNLAGVGWMNMRGARVGQSATQNNYWKSPEEPGDGKTPRPNDSPKGNNRGTSQRYVDTGTFLRINNMTLSYLFPKRIPQKLMLKSLRIYINSTNTFTFTKNETSFNPDVSNSENSLTPGVSFSDYPLPRVIIVGINVGL